MKRYARLLCIYFAAALPDAAAIPLKLSTSLQEVPIGVMVDEDDGKTAETALSIANTDIKIWKAGATSLANKNSGGATHISGGVYYAVLDGTDTDTLGPLVLFVHKAGALPKRVNCVVHPANVYDSLVGSEKLDVNVAKINSVSTSSVTTVNANLGSTQPINFTGSGASANVKSTNPFFVASGTATDGGTSDLEWLNGSSTNDFCNGMMIVVFDASTNNRPHVATVTDWDGSAGILTFSPAMSVSVANGDTFQLLYVPREIKGIYDSLAAGVTLANDAITAAKFDESTAFPLMSADTGDTTVLRKGSSNITGTSLDTAIDGVPIANDVADAVLGALISSRPTGSLGKAVGDIFDFLDGAPTFAKAMDGHGYTTALAENLNAPRRHYW